MNKKIIPIVFCIDKNMELHAGVCITSLLLNAKSSTFYDIYILHSDEYSFMESKLNELPLIYRNCEIHYRSVGNIFESAFEIRGITTAAYFRLLIPDIIPEYDKIIYSDVDVIFRNDLSHIFENTDLTGYYVSGVVDALSLASDGHKDYINNVLHLSWTEYICSGNLILNSFLLRQDNIVERFICEVKQSTYTFQDQDILNLVCRGKILRMPPVFGYATDIVRYAANMLDNPLYTLDELQQVQSEGIVHFVGLKPWNEWCPNFDIWWEYYRKSIYFDSKFYYEFYDKRKLITVYDCLSLWERIKLVMKYFTKGKEILRSHV